MKPRFILLTILLLLSRGADIASTYFATPDLAGEMNPIQAIFNGGWTGVLLVNLLIVILALYAAYFQMHRYQPKPTSIRFSSIWSYISWCYYDNPNLFSKVLYKIPTDRKTSWAHFGYALPRALILGGLLAAFHNVALGTGLGVYQEVVAAVKRPSLFIYGLIIASFLYFLYHFARKELAARQFVFEQPLDQNQVR